MEPVTVLLLTAGAFAALRMLSRKSETSTKTTIKQPPARIASALQAASAKYDVPLDLLTGVAWVESRYKTDAVSRVGAQGVMQLMPSVAKGLGVTDSLNPEQNIMGGAKFLKALYKKYGNWSDALAAYNWGPGNVDKGTTWPSSVQAYVSKVTNASQAVA